MATTSFSLREGDPITMVLEGEEDTFQIENYVPLFEKGKKTINVIQRKGKIQLSGDLDYLDRNNLKDIIASTEEEIIASTEEEKKEDRNEILARCDDWMKLFKKSLYRLLRVSSESNCNYKPQVFLGEITDDGVLTYGVVYLSIIDEFGNPVIDGIQMKIPVDNPSVYTYLVASILGYCLNKYFNCLYFDQKPNLNKPIYLDEDNLIVYLAPRSDDLLTKTAIENILQRFNNTETRNASKDVKDYLKQFRLSIADQKIDLKGLEEELAYAEYDTKRILRFKPKKKED